MSRKLSGQFLWQLFWWECQTGRETWPPPHLHGNLATYTRGHLFRLCCKFKQITSIKIISVSLAVWPVSETQVFSLIGCNQSFDPVKFVSSNPSHPPPPPTPPKSLLTINLGHLGTWKGIQVQTSSLLTMRRDCTDAWCIAIYFALCKFWIKLVHVYECLEKLRLNSFYCYAGQVSEIQNWLYCLRHQITSDTMPVWDRAWGGGGTVGPEARNQTWHGHCQLCTMYCCTSVRFLPLRCQVTHLYNRHSPCGI